MTINEQMGEIRRLLLQAGAYCPSEEQCLTGDRGMLAVNSKITLEAIGRSLELLTGSRGNIGANQKPKPTRVQIYGYWE